MLNLAEIADLAVNRAFAPTCCTATR